MTIDFEAPRFVLTDVQDDVIEVLDDKGVVVLTGGPGCGKSYQGQAVLRHYRERGYTPYTLRSFTDWDSHVGPDTRSVVLADGLFGETLVDKAEHKAWTQVRKTATALTAQGHCKLVITVYSPVLRTLLQLENGTRSPLLDPVVVSLPGSLDTTVKTRLLHVHLKELDLPEDRQREVVEAVLHKDVSGPVFAWCCDWMVRHWHSAQHPNPPDHWDSAHYSTHPTDIFSQPAEAYVPLLGRLLLLDKERGETMAAVLALAMRGLGGFLHDPRRVQPDLQELRFHGKLSDYRLEEHADLLKGFILAHDGYGFTSRVLYDAAGLALGRAYSVSVMLQVCDVRFLVNYVTTDPQADLAVIVGDKPSLRELYQQRLQQLTTKTRAVEDQQIEVLEELIMCLLFVRAGQRLKQAAKSFLKAIVKTQGERKQQIQYKWPKAQFTSRSSQESLSRLQTQGACYLDAPSKPIPRSLLSVSVQEDEVSVDLAGQHLYLVLRLLTDTERDEQDDDGNTVFHLAALAGLWNILVMADRESLMISNKQRKTPIQLFRKKLQQSQGFFTKRAPSDDNVLLELFEASESTWNGGDTALHWAVQMAQTYALRLLIQHGASVNEKNKGGVTALQLKDGSGNTLLHWAVKQGNTDFVRLLIQHGASVNEKDKDGEAALHHVCKSAARHNACRSSTTDIIGELLQHGAEVNVTDNYGHSPLYYVIFGGKVDNVRLLIQHGASVNAEVGFTVLQLACDFSDVNGLDIVGELLQHGAEVNKKDEAGNTQLHWAARLDHHIHERLLILLIQHGASVNEKNKNGETALHIACKVDDHCRLFMIVVGQHPIPFSDSISELLQHGAEINAKDNAGNTPLHWAAANHDSGIVHSTIQNLIKSIAKNEDTFGAETLNVKDSSGKTPLHWATECGYIDTVSLLIQHGASVNEKNKNGETALHMAGTNTRVSIGTVVELLQHGAEVNVKDNKRNTPLHTAAEHGKTKNVLLLIQHGARKNERNKYGETALHLACKHYDRTDTVVELLKHGAKVNAKDNDSNTPLHWAAWQLCNNHILEPVELGTTAMVRVLIQHGASVNEKNTRGETALHHIACAVVGGANTIGVLLQHGAEVNVKDNAGETPLLLASQQNRNSLVRLLKKHGAV